MINARPERDCRDEAWVNPLPKPLQARKPTVLVVDDVRDYCEEIAEGLRRDGMDVYVASSGPEAISMGSLLRPDVVVTDWMLKDHIHGLDVSDAIALVAPAVRTILITGFASEDLRLDARAAEIFEFLEKPFPMEEIRKAVKRATASMRPWRHDVSIGFLELGPDGEILYANVAAEEYMEHAVPDGIATNIRELFDDECMALVEGSTDKWVEVHPLSNSEEIWHLRTRQLTDRSSRIIVLFNKRFATFRHSAVVHRLLGLPESTSRALNLDGHILVVDDFEAIRRLAVNVLRHFRCVCHTAQTHEEAIRLFAHDTDIRFIVLDCEVPGGSARDFVQRVRTLRPETKILGTSGKDKRQFFSDLGVTEFMSKPWEVSELVKTLEKMAAG